MDITLYQLDAFSDLPFGGNPAAVCPLPDWLPDNVLQKIALENNLSETAFVVAGQGVYHLRWFTPAIEVNLCGHATLATAQVVFDKLEPTAREVHFETRSGRLSVRRSADSARLEMDFPALPPQEAPPPPAAFFEPLGLPPLESYRVREVHGAPYLLAVYDRQSDIAGLRPNVSVMQANIMVTAPAVGDDLDFVSRYFAPLSGVSEDPVTGSAHCTLTPYWAKRLGKTELRARQISARGGDLLCRLQDDRVILSGACAYYMEGVIRI